MSVLLCAAMFGLCAVMTTRTGLRLHASAPKLSRAEREQRTKQLHKAALILRTYTTCDDKELREAI